MINVNGCMDSEMLQVSLTGGERVSCIIDASTIFDEMMNWTLT